MAGKLGEREAIRILTSMYGQTANMPLKFDDDVAAVPLDNGRWMILKTDMLVWSTDVPPGVKLWQGARKAVVATVSDFAAKGVRPKALMVSLGLPGSTSRKALREIGRGLAAGAKEYQCKLVGGDTNQSNDLVIDCVGAGVADPESLMRRKGARPGDVVAVTEEFGNSAGGLRLLLSEGKPVSSEDRRMVRAVTLPRARLNEGLALARTGAVTSSIDSSDGLAWSLHELCRSSNVSIHLGRVPLAREAEEYAERTGLEPMDLALYGGEEYELVVTVKADRFEGVKKRVPRLIPIGTVRKGPPSVGANVGGRTLRVEARGWEHFRRNP